MERIWDLGLGYGSILTPQGLAIELRVEALRDLAHWGLLSYLNPK